MLCFGLQLRNMHWPVKDDLLLKAILVYISSSTSTILMLMIDGEQFTKKYSVILFVALLFGFIKQKFLNVDKTSLILIVGDFNLPTP